MISHRGTFKPAKINRQGAQGHELGAYRSRFELGLVVALFSVMMVFVISKRIEKRMEVPIYVISDNIWALDLPPKTTRGGAPRAPSLPKVPIPVEDEILPEEETIELTDLDFTIGIPDIEGLGLDSSGEMGGGSGGPRPVHEVLPRYPEDLQKKGVEGIVLLSILINERGIVDSVYVVNNSSGSRRLADAAMQAARKTRYMPSKQKKGRRGVWIERPYMFEGK